MVLRVFHDFPLQSGNERSYTVSTEVQRGDRGRIGRGNDGGHKARQVRPKTETDVADEPPLTADYRALSSHRDRRTWDVRAYCGPDSAFADSKADAVCTTVQ